MRGCYLLKSPLSTHSGHPENTVRLASVKVIGRASQVSLIACLLLFGCSRGYKITATLTAETLSFHAPDDRSKEFKVCDFYVLDTSREPPPQDPKVWPQEPLWKQPNVMWAFSVPFAQTEQGCSTYPVIYGRTPPGHTVRIAPKPLKRDVTYQVMNSSAIDGFGRFRLTTVAENIDEREHPRG